MARVFISYRRVEPDQSVARLLYHHLSDLDHDVFLDAEHIPVGAFWDRQIEENVRRSDTFIPLVSLNYLFSDYIIEKELKPAARLLGENKIERLLQVNLAYDGDPPEAVREVISQIQYFKWRSPADTPRLCDEIAARLPSAELFVKGMRPFVTADQKLFSQLGREDEIADFLKLLHATQVSFVVVHGVSGAGKSSFLKAGVAPRLIDLPWTMAELTADADADFGALTAAEPQLVVLDQFEQSLIRFATDEEERRSFEKLVANWTTQHSQRKVIFCLRDEYRTAFDAMLPELSSRSVHFALLPLRPEVAARVLHADFTGYVVVWHIRDAKGAGRAIEPEVRALPEDQIVMRLAFRPNSYDLIAVTNGITARYLNVNYDQPQNSVVIQELLQAAPESKITGLSMNAAGDHIVVGDTLGRATVWWWEISRSIMPRLSAALFSPSGRFLFARTHEGLKLFDMTTYASGVTNVSLDEFNKQPVAFSDDERMFAVKVDDDSEHIIVYNSSNIREKLYDVKCGSDFEELAFSSDGQRLFCRLGDKSLVQVELKNGNASMIMKGDQNAYTSLSPRGKHLIARVILSDSPKDDHRLVRLFNLENLQKTLEVEVERHHLNDYLAFTADEKTVAGVNGQTVIAWESATGRELWRYPVPERVEALAFGGDGVLAVGLGRQTIVLNMKTKEVIARLSSDTIVRAVGISPDGQHVMVGSRDEKLRVWNLKPLELRVVIERVEPTDRTRFSPDGKYVFIHGHRRAPTGVTVSETRILVWRPEDLLDEACQRIMHNFTEEEWRQYFGAEPYLQAPCGDKPSKRIRFAN